MVSANGSSPFAEQYMPFCNVFLKKNTITITMRIGRRHILFVVASYYFVFNVKPEEEFSLVVLLHINILGRILERTIGKVNNW